MTDITKESNYQDVADLRAENAKLRAEVDFANERAGKAEHELALLRESYEKLKGMLLRRQERDNDLDKAQIEDLHAARNHWDTQVTFQGAAKDGSAMRAVIEASEKLIALLERNYAIVLRANERVVAERDSKTHSAACVFCDWKGPNRSDWNEANADVATHDCERHPYRLERDKLRAELAALRQQAEAAAPSDAEIEAWRSKWATRASVGFEMGEDYELISEAVALMRRAKSAPAQPERIHVHKVTQTGEHFCETQCEERKKLQAFKDYVHQRLDDAGVPPNPSPPKHALHGCRIGDRLDWVLAAEPPAPSAAAGVAVPEDVRKAAEHLHAARNLYAGTHDGNDLVTITEFILSLPTAAWASQPEPGIRWRGINRPGVDGGLIVERDDGARLRWVGVDGVDNTDGNRMPLSITLELKRGDVVLNTETYRPTASQPEPAAQGDAELQALLDDARQCIKTWDRGRTGVFALLGVVEALARKAGCK